MECKLGHKKVAYCYSHHFDETKVKCPVCEFNSSRTKTYKSLKQLTFHLSEQHKNEGNYYPFTVDDIKTLMQMIALAKEWKLLV